MSNYYGGYLKLIKKKNWSLEEEQKITHKVYTSLKGLHKNYFLQLNILLDTLKFFNSRTVQLLKFSVINEIVTCTY